MSLREQLSTDLVASRRAKNAAATNALQLALTAISTAEKSGPAHTVDDSEVLRILAKEAKKRSETIDLARKAGRRDVVDREQAELDVIETYLPQIDEAAVASSVSQAVTSALAEGLSGGRAKGAVIKAVRAVHPDADPALIAALANEQLG